MKIFFALILLLTPQIAFAQAKPAEQKIKKPPVVLTPEESDQLFTMAGPYYEHMALQAIRYRPKNFEFSMLRNYYTQIPEYDPVGELASNRLVVLAYRAENETDQGKREAALAEFQKLVVTHLANMDVMAQALSLSKQNTILGDPKFYEWMRAGLLRSVLQSGDGSRLTKAYDVVTLGEESALMRELGYKVLRTETEHAGRLYYNMHEVTTPGHAKPFWIFVDVTEPMTHFERKRSISSRSFSIPRQ